MEPNILDLRQERCPMALLLAKRHTKKFGCWRANSTAGF